MRRRILALVSVASLAAVAVSGLAAIVGPPAGVQPVEITLLEWQVPRSEATKGLLAGFEREMADRGTPVRVRLETLSLGDDEFNRWIADAYSDGTAPDLTSYPTVWIPDFAAAGHLLDLTERLSAWPDWQRFYPILRERATNEQGRVYSVPRGATVIQLFYRRDVLEAHGVSTDQPRSWDDLVERMIALRDRMDRPPLLIPAGTQWVGGAFDEGFVNLHLGTGGPLYDEAADRWVVRSPGISSVFELYHRLVVERLLPVEPLLKPEPWTLTKYQTFRDGDLAVTTQGTWGWDFDWGPDGRAPIERLRERVGTWAFPPEQPGPPFVWASESWGWTISARSAQPDAAFALLVYLTSGRALAVDLVAVGNLAPRDDVAGLAPYAGRPELVAEERLLGIGRSFEPRAGIDAVRRAVAAATEGIITGRLDGPGAAAEFERLVRAELGADRVMTLDDASPSPLASASP